MYDISLWDKLNYNRICITAVQSIIWFIRVCTVINYFVCVNQATHLLAIVYLVRNFLIIHWFSNTGYKSNWIFAKVWLTSKRNEQRNASTVFMNECWNEADCIPIISGKRNLVLRFDRMMFSSLSNDLNCE